MELIMTRPKQNEKLRKICALFTQHETVPSVGRRIDVNLSMVVSEDKDGNAKTPMLKIRYSIKQQKWVQIPISHAGLMVFLNSEPEAHHKAIQITAIIPSQTACYANPVA